MTFELLTECNRKSGLYHTRRGYEEAKKTWNPPKLLKRYRRHLRLVTESFDLLEAAIVAHCMAGHLTEHFTKGMPQYSSTTASFFTAIDHISPNVDDEEDERNGDDSTLAAFAAGDQSEEQVIEQVEGFTQAYQAIPVPQRKELGSVVQNFFDRVNSSVIVGGSNNRGGGNQYMASCPSQQPT
ncbi:hypothetical protein SERLADRAFT_412843 [Serpula lacrymans var. lacrymans S7.9]|uniref:Uncharacterized protein n=1 Tax=Serpula lacrymans var. lacrymans (strain S7.9) TaxID=578457 RepID=F8NIC2_SERL9|nr:uncharacterized protein SERLADRAFT_412843 [Serpula lacrymans var. lacrymans S7.9]EGO29268.1 hypothetical protein SERLADRAFT_412843 [Serpula lacrymans var. lacrymans S7.9]